MENNEILSFAKRFKPGTKFKFSYPDIPELNQTWHVLAIVDEWYVVVKTWSKKKQRWKYEVKNISFLFIEDSRGLLSFP